MIFFEVYGIVLLIAHLLAFVICVVSAGFEGVGFAWLNPRYIYKNVKVNWFGASFLALIATALLPGIAFCYWFYKLCVVGRE